MKMKFACCIWFLTTLVAPATAQNFLGKTKKDVIDAKKGCLAINKYPTSVVFSCSNVREYYYFEGKDTTCDLYARDLPAQQATDTLQYLQAHGFTKLETRYIEAFIASKHTNHQKFPLQVYTDGVVQYCFMPVSLNGKSANMNAVIVMYKKRVRPAN